MTALLTAALAAVLTLPAPAAAAPSAPPAAGLEAAYAQVMRSEAHVHRGELGEKYLMLERNLKCDCGCGLDVHSCQFQMQCGTSPVWSQRIKSQLEQGMTPEAIEAGFVAEFGPTVLMAPPATGFNLVGYLLPAVAILTAGMLVGLLARGGFRDDEQELVPAQDLSDEDARRLREEMRRMEEAESPDW